LIISRGTALLLLIVYIAYLFFQVHLFLTPETNGNVPDFAQLKSHNYLFVPAHESDELEDARMSTISAASA
jgi:hypothetical protein